MEKRCGNGHGGDLLQHVCGNSYRCMGCNGEMVVIRDEAIDLTEREPATVKG